MEGISCDLYVLESERLGHLSCYNWQQHCCCQLSRSAAIANPYAHLVCQGQSQRFFGYRDMCQQHQMVLSRLWAHALGLSPVL